MSWLTTLMIKESRRRRFRANDKVRYFTEGRKGHNQVVLTPKFEKGVVQDFDQQTRRYLVLDDSGQVQQVHPQNIILDGLPPRLSPQSPEISTPPTAPTPPITQPFPR